VSHVLVMFGSTHGHTSKVARAVADRVRSHGHRVDVVNAGTDPVPDPNGYDGVVVAASLHIGAYQREVVNWVTDHAAALNQRPTAFVSVSLGVLQHDAAVQQNLRTILAAFETKSGWQPLDVELAAGALQYSRYNLLVRWLMKRIARKAGGSTDTRHDHEYTDWPSLERFTDRFTARLGTPISIATRPCATGA
jgi:menaquinone-dependent protoporphyrinogen oxidase